MSENKYTRALDYIGDQLVELEKKLGNEIGTVENAALLCRAIEACKYLKQPEFDLRFASPEFKNEIVESAACSEGDRVLALHKEVHAILDAGLEWGHYFVFKSFSESGLSINGVDTDTTCEEDVRAFVRALDEKAAPYLALQAATARGGNDER